MNTLVRPFVLSFTEPIVFCWNIYIALVYGILYIFIESFRVVFVENHGFNIGENGLAFLVSQQYHLVEMSHVYLRIGCRVCSLVQ